MKAGAIKILLAVAVIILLLKIPITYFDPNNAVEERIADDISFYGLKKVFIHYVFHASLEEEAFYRILWAVPFLFVFRKNSLVRNIFYALVVGPPTFYWAFAHPYPWPYCLLIFVGGLFSDGLILYFSQTDRWQDYLRGILMPFLMHAEVNLIIVGWVYLFM